MITLFSAGRKIKRAFLILSIFCLTSCAFQSEFEQNLIKSLEFREALRNQGLHSEVIYYHYTDKKINKKFKHSVVVFIYPNNSSLIRVYDKRGTLSFFKFSNDPKWIIETAERSRKDQQWEIKNAAYAR